MPEVQKTMPSLLDKEIQSTEEDAFGHRHYAKALEDLIESSSNTPPYTLGLLGKWGVGKSSIKTLYISSFQGPNSKDRLNKIHTITFNAWRYGGENLKRALLRQVYLALGGDETLLKDALFRQIHRAQMEKRTWKSFIREVWDVWGWGILQILCVILIFFAGPLFILAKTFHFSNEWVILGLIAVLMSGNIGIIKYLFDPKNTIVRRYSNVTKIEAPNSSSEQYEDLLLDQLQQFKAGKTNISNSKQCERLVIFVDDLDRLPAEEMVTGLDAIRSFMDINTPKGIGIVFVISCDEDRVAEALAGRKRDKSSDLPGTIFNRMDARRFLDRIFQFRLEIPQFPRRDMRNFAMKRMNTDLPQIVKDLQDRQVSLENLIGRMIHVGVQSPRNALQILNAFAQSWWIAKQRERDGSGTERPGGLQEGAVTNHPITLAILSAMRVDFPDFYGDLQQDSELITRFTNVTIRQMPLSEQSETARNLLKKYFMSDEIELKQEHRSLRQFLSGVQGIQWPPTLQPLLLLSQDPVTRKLGDKAVALYDSFVSGDSQGVLAGLGRDKDQNELTREEVLMLSEIMEEIQLEDDIRKNNGAVVVASLILRLPEQSRKMLVVPLARRLVESHELRWRLGIKKIEEVTTYALPQEKKSIAGKLIVDLLKVEGSIDFKLESGETPSINEAVSIVREACELIFNIRKELGMYPLEDKMLLEWLENRQVEVGKQSFEFSFDDFEQWLQTHEDHLLSSLSTRYIELLYQRVEAEQTKNLNMDAALRRSREIFDRLLAAGEESRQELWHHLNRYVELKQPEFVELAWTMISTRINLLTSADLTEFVSKFSERLHKQMVEEKWALDKWEEATISLLNILSQRVNDVGTQTHENLAVLTIDWSSNDSTEKYAVQLAEFIKTCSKNQFNIVMKNWLSRILTDLTKECIKYIGENFTKTISSEDHDILFTQIDQMHNRGAAPITEEEAENYNHLMLSFTPEALKLVKLQTHLQNVISRIEQNYNNPNKYLDRILPTIVLLLEFAPANSVGSMLHNLFANTRGVPDIYGWLHNIMSDHWLASKPELSPYNPEQIFNEAKIFIDQNPSHKWSFGCLISMKSMLKKGIVPDDQKTILIEASNTLWNIHRKLAAYSFISVKAAASPVIIAGLIDQIDLNNNEDKDQVVMVWTHMQKYLPEEESWQVAKLILQKQPVQNTKDYDFALQLWISIQQKQSNFLYSLVTDENLNEDQRIRVWIQVQHWLDVLGDEFFIQHLKQLLTDFETVEFSRTIFKYKVGVNSLFPTIKERNILAGLLLQAFFEVTSLESKNNIATWLQEIGGANVLGKLGELEASEDDLDLLKKYFPESKKLSKFMGA